MLPSPTPNGRRWSDSLLPAHRAPNVAIPQDSKDPSEMIEGHFVRFQEGLLCRPLIGSMKSAPAGPPPTGEDLRFLHLLSKPDPGLVPIDLGLLSPLIGLW